MDSTIYHIIYLSLGSNIGDRLYNLSKAVTGLQPKVKPKTESSVYETEPWGYSDQPNFLNQVVKAETYLSPLDLLSFLKETEIILGRQETFRFGPRLIDIDILFYDELVVESPDLTIPHPRIAERAFVLVPLTEIAPDLVHPVVHKTIQQLRTDVDAGSVELFHSAIS